MTKNWLKGNCVCLAKGDAVALNLMFEDKKDHKLFFQCWKKYLGDMAKIIHYHLSPTGWVLLLKTNSDEEIKTAYHKQRMKSNKANPLNTLIDPSRMLSEHFRIFLSQFVRRSNARHGRSGTKVKQRFQKHVFDAMDDYEKVFENITRLMQIRPSQIPKYQADETQYDMGKEMKKDSVWKAGSRLYDGLCKGFGEWLGVVLMDPQNPILRKILSNPRKPKIQNRFT